MRGPCAVQNSMRPPALSARKAALQTALMGKRVSVVCALWGGTYLQNQNIKLLIFFFIKQMVSYEMLISDWCSALFSTDLRRCCNYPAPSDQPREACLGLFRATIKMPGRARDAVQDQ